MKNILVTGATGNVGRQLVSDLLARGARVRAMVRHPQTADLPPEAQVCHGDLSVPSTLETTLDGIDAVFLMWQAPAGTVNEVIKRIASRTPHIVFLSNLTVRDDVKEQEYSVTTLHAQIERLIQASGAQWSFLPAIIEMLLKAWPVSIGNPAVVTETVAEVTGSPAHSFSEWAVDHVADFLG